MKNFNKNLPCGWKDCPKVFSHRSSLSRHRVTVHGYTKTPPASYNGPLEERKHDYNETAAKNRAKKVEDALYYEKKWEASLTCALMEETI